MKLLIQAVQAVSVEVFGVVLVCWLLLHIASWGLRTTVGHAPGWNTSAKIESRDLAQAFPLAKAR